MVSDSIPNTGRGVVRRIAVRGLFGHYSYDLPDLDGELSILYGDNGTGKTTILRLLHHLVSCAHGSGHKTWMANVPFKEFVVEFADGHSIQAFRSEAQPGSFTASLALRGAHVHTTLFESLVEPGRHIIPPRGEHSDSQDVFTDAVREAFGLDSYFLGDDRTLEGDALPLEDEDFYLSRAITSPRELQQILQGRRNMQLDFALRRATEWSRRQVLNATSVGSANVNTIYADVVRQLSLSPSREDGEAVAEDLFPRLLEDLDELAKRSDEQNRFGLASPFDAVELKQSLQAADPERRPVILRLLRPYVDGIRARLDALSDVYTVLRNFTKTLDDFLLDKEVDFKVNRGLIVSASEGPLQPEHLSSGEKHLLLVMCNLLSAREQSSLFLIDEPELSLNVKWQRALIPALLGCTAGSSIQLILATHSIELLSSYLPRVVQLDRRQDDTFDGAIAGI